MVVPRLQTLSSQGCEGVKGAASLLALLWNWLTPLRRSIPDTRITLLTSSVSWMLAQLSVTALLVLCCFPETEVLQGRFNFTYWKGRENLDLDMTRFLCPLSSSVFQLSLPSPFHKQPCGAGAEALKPAGRCTVGLRLGALEGACGLLIPEASPQPHLFTRQSSLPAQEAEARLQFLQDLQNQPQRTSSSEVCIPASGDPSSRIGNSGPSRPPPPPRG